MKKGFTYIEVMMAIAVFLIMAVCVMKLNIEANKNINKQIDKQDMMMEAQKQLEKTKTIILEDEDNYYEDPEYIPIKDSPYYVKRKYNSIESNYKDLVEITVKIRKSNDEVILTSHYYKNEN